MRIGEKCVMKDLVVGDRGRYFHSKEEFVVVWKVPGYTICHFPNNKKWQFCEDYGKTDVEYLGKAKLGITVIPELTLEEAAKSLNKYLRKIRAAWYAVGITNGSLVVYYDGLSNDFTTWESFPVSWVKTEIPVLN